MTARSVVALPRLAPDREGQQERDRDRHDEPGRAPFADQGGQAERKDHSGGGDPVVAGDELPHPQRRRRGSASRLGHLASATGSTRKSRTSSEREDQHCRRRSPAARRRPPGHRAPAPSAPQKIPNEVSITPTPNFIAFSGTRASGARIAMPDARRPAGRPRLRPAAARPTRCWFAPKVRAMKTTSRPSSRTPLKAIVNE